MPLKFAFARPTWYAADGCRCGVGAWFYQVLVLLVIACPVLVKGASSETKEYQRNHTVDEGYP